MLFDIAQYEDYIYLVKKYKNITLPSGYVITRNWNLDKYEYIEYWKSTVAKTHNGIVNPIYEDIMNENIMDESPIAPQHYGGSDNMYEAIKVIQAWELNFSLGNVVKYIARVGKKAGNTEIQELKKARKYLDYEILQLENKIKQVG